jgi:hypothetical protein
MPSIYNGNPAFFIEGERSPIRRSMTIEFLEACGEKGMTRKQIAAQLKCTANRFNTLLRNSVTRTEAYNRGLEKYKAENTSCQTNNS